MSITTPEQHLIRGKIRAYKPSTNVQDILASHELSVVFRSVDAHLNYWLLYDIFVKHYLDVDHLFIQPFMFTVVDIWRDAIYRINFFELIATSLTDNTFDYSQQKVGNPEFTLVFKFNFTDVEFLLDKSKVLQLAGSEVLTTQNVIIQKR